MISWPHTIEDLEKICKSEKKSREFIKQLRWPKKKSTCPKCSNKIWETKEEKFICSYCKKEYTLTSGTIFHNSRIPISKWLRVIWKIAHSTETPSILSLQKELGINSYKTIYKWINNVRHLFFDTKMLDSTVYISYMSNLEHSINNIINSKNYFLIFSKSKSLNVRIFKTNNEHHFNIEEYLLNRVKQDSLIVYEPSLKEIVSKTIFWRTFDKIKYDYDTANEICDALILWINPYIRYNKKSSLDEIIQEFVFFFNRRDLEPSELFRMLIIRALFDVL